MSPIYENKSLTLEDYREFYGAIIRGETHGPFEGLFCFCPSCLCHLYKETHKRSKIEEENFFFVWLLVQRGEYRIEKGKKVFRADWKHAEDLIFQIEDRKFLDYPEGSRNEKYRIAQRYKKIIAEAKKEKFDLIVYFNEKWLRINEAILRKAVFKATKKCSYMDEKLLKKIKNFSKEKERGASLRQLERRFTKKKADLTSLIYLYGKEAGIYWAPDENKVYTDGKDAIALRNPLDEIIREIKESVGMMK